MSLIVPPGYGLAAMVYTGAVGTQPYVTTCGFVLQLGQATAAEAADQIMTAWGTYVMPETTSLLTLDRVQLYVGDDGPSGSVDSTAAAIPGGRAGTYPPTAQSAIIRKVTSDLGRRGRGRMFLPGVLTEAEVDQDGTVVAARRTSLGLVMENMRADFATAQAGVGAMVLLHSQAPADPSLIEALPVSDLVGWIRGRIR